MRNAEFGMRPEPRRVQGSPALYVVQGGMRNEQNRYWLHGTRYWLTDKDGIRNEKMLLVAG